MGEHQQEQGSVATPTGTWLPKATETTLTATGTTLTTTGTH